MSPDVQLRHDLRIDVPATLAMGAGLVVYNLTLREQFLPDACRWCDGSRPDGLNDVDRFFRDLVERRDPRPAIAASHAVSFVAGPMTVAALMSLAADHENERLRNAPLDLLLVAEAGYAALTLNEMLKALTARERPIIHRIEDDQEHAARVHEAGALLSFPSGHTLAVFAATAAAGTIATMRGYRLAPLIWIAGSILGTTAGYLRMAAGQHYFTDTVAGAGLGVIVGGGIPWLFHRPLTGKPSWTDHAMLTTQPVPSGTGRVLSLTLAF